MTALGRKPGQREERQRVPKLVPSQLPSSTSQENCDHKDIFADETYVNPIAMKPCALEHMVI